MLEVKKLKKRFGSNVVLNDISFNVSKGDIISIVGPSGSGKSTVLRCIDHLEKPEAGSIYIDGALLKEGTPEYNKLRSKMGFVFQHFNLFPNMTVLENLSMAKNKGKSFNLTLGLDKKNIKLYRNILATLDLGLENQLDTKVGLLSGGQRQCLSLIMSTINHPDVLLLDEHTAALDPKTSKIILDKTKELVEKNNITTLMITHNLQDAIEYGSRLIMIHDGDIMLDLKGEEKKNLTVEKLLEFFHEKDAKLSDTDLF